MPLGPHDDKFHSPTTDEPTWAETAWFAAWAAEEGLVFWFYPLFRPQLGVMQCAVYVFGPGKHEPWQVPYYSPHWHMPIPDGIEGPCDFELPNSLTYETIEPLSTYRITYQDGNAFAADLTFTAIHEAHAFGVEEGRGHLDQLGRVQGSVILHGRHLEVDAVEMRDRTWSPRREARQRTRLGYSYGANDDARAFHCSVRFSELDKSRFMTGFMLDDGRKVDLVDGRREVERDARGRPTRLRLQLQDAEGATHAVLGEVEGQMTMYTSPYVVWSSSVRWSLPDGSTVHGGDQDVWSPRRLHDFLDRD